MNRFDVIPQENRLESAKLLLGAGADPSRQSKYGDDILQTACLKGALMIFNFLLENVIYEPERCEVIHKD